MRSFVEKALVEHVFPLDLSFEARTEKLFNIFSELNDRQINSFINILDTQLKYVSFYNTGLNISSYCTFENILRSVKISKLFFGMCLEYAVGITFFHVILL